MTNPDWKPEWYLKQIVEDEEARARAKTKIDEANIKIDIEAPYEVARAFLNSRYSQDDTPTLRRWCGEWRRWDGTHYAKMGKEELRSELWDFLSRVNNGRFNPKNKYVNELVAALEGLAILPSEVEGGSWLDEGTAPPWGTGAMVSCKNGVVRLSDGQMWRHDPRLFVLSSIETEYRPGVEAVPSLSW